MFDHVPRRVTFEDLCVAVAAGDPLRALPEEVAVGLRGAKRPLALTDFAGRDSVAAAMAWLECHPVGTLVPVGDVVPTRFGEWAVYEDNWKSMRDQVGRRHPGVSFAPWFVMEDVDAWRLLNARYINELIAAFGFFTPCLGCHLHFYMMRAVLAHALGAEVLISGEKELHGRKRKANQTDEAVAAYRGFSERHGVHHEFPIQKVTTEAEMGRLLGDGWREGERQLACVMSGNDQGFDGNLVMKPGQIQEYMERFAVPLATHLVEFRRAGLSGSELHRRADEVVRGLLTREEP